MRTYHLLTSEERYALATLRRQGYSMRGIARARGRALSTVSREVRRNRRKDGRYRCFTADQRARARRSRSRRNQRFTAADWALVLSRLQQEWSPEQISGRLGKDGALRISHETIYRFIWRDKRQGGTHYKRLRQAGKKRRKRYGSYDSRGRLAGKRHISERPPAVEDRAQVGHWEIDTVLGKGKPCIVTLVERATGYLLIGKMKARNVAELNQATLALLSSRDLPVRTITADNGTEFHGYADIEAATDIRFFFATPHHSWERGSSENANGLIRQYLPKRTSLMRLTQDRCDAIAYRLNTRPRKCYDYRTPEEELELRST